MSNFGDSSNYESYPYYEPTSNASQQQMNHPPPGSSSQQAAEMNSWSNGQRGWSNVQQQQRFQGQGHDSNTDDGSIVQNNVHAKPSHLNESAISPPIGLDHRSSFRTSAPTYRPQPVAHSQGYQEQYMVQPQYQQKNEQTERIALLEWRQQRVEKENEILFSENQKLQTSYSAALDQLAKQLVKALVQQQITQDQLIFSGTQAAGGVASFYQMENRSGRGILKPSGPSPASSPALYPFRLDSTAAPELTTEGPSNAEKLAAEYLMDEPMNKAPSLQNMQQLPPNKILPPSGIVFSNNPHHLSHHSPMPPMSSNSIVRPPMIPNHLSSPFTLSSKPPLDVMSAIHAASPRIHAQSKKVWFGNDAVSVGAKSAPAGKIELPDTDSECSDHSESDRSSLSSNATDDGRNMNDESLVHDINNIVKQQSSNNYRHHNWTKKTESIRSEPSNKLNMVSPGSQRWNLQRKDSMHSLASEPTKTDQVTPFQRGAKSHSSLHRFRMKESKKSSHQDRHSSSVDRSLSPSSKPFYDHETNRGTPPSLAIPAGIKPISARELHFQTNKKKKKSLMELFRSKFTTKKKEGIERVETPTGQWMNRSFSPTKSDTDSAAKLNRHAVKSTPGRKSIG